MKKYSIQRKPFIVPTNDGKLIEEHFGLASIKSPLSIAKMKAPPFWSEPFQTPEFDEYTFIISGKKQIIIDDEIIILKTGESIKVNSGTRVQYSNPFDQELEYVSVCFPAFSVNLVHRED